MGIISWDHVGYVIQESRNQKYHKKSVTFSVDVNIANVLHAMDMSNELLLAYSVAEM